MSPEIAVIIAVITMVVLFINPYPKILLSFTRNLSEGMALLSHLTALKSVWKDLWILQKIEFDQTKHTELIVLQQYCHLKFHAYNLLW